ncbi:MAG: tRNA (adenosine(37)-N6)-dimethylallyltransferase MiaA [Treponema sp.]|nr:tRNA (adenosine(37)-N6)-dimethylallyltransferase MiaA [Treponema sp.]
MNSVWTIRRRRSDTSGTSLYTESAAAGKTGDRAVPVFVLFGPTASGKTEALARLFSKDSLFPDFAGKAEVVSADSMQVYRGMDIGTAKPSPRERERLPHHLVDIRDPREQFNAGDFVRLAGEACEDIWRRGKLPVVSGGTGFYLRNFIMGLPESPPSDGALRAVLKAELESRGAAFLMEELASGDPESAARIHINDEYRLLRALEVLRQTGRPLSAYRRNGGREGRFDFFIAGIRCPREELYRRVNERCAAMFRNGLAGEVRRLAEAGYGPGDPGLRAIGYREFFTGDGKGPFAVSEDLAAVEELAARNSRRYAKRQIVYFASVPGVRWIDTEGESSGMAERLFGILFPVWQSSFRLPVS